jgi:hypothetical protein
MGGVCSTLGRDVIHVTLSEKLNGIPYGRVRYILLNNIKVGEK